MIESIVDSWMFWLTGAVAGTILLQFLGKTRSTEVQPGMATKSDEFSMRGVFFSFRSGEAGLFLTVVWVQVCVFCFAIVIAKHFGSILPAG